MIMMNLFSVFDPTSYFGLSINWVILVMIFIMSPLVYYIFGSDYVNVYMLFKMMIKNMFLEVATIKGRILVYLCVSTFLYLMMSNLMGLFPFIFTSTAHPMITMSLGLVMWMSFFLMGWLKSFKQSAAHLVPEGSPLGLSPLLVLIESVSHLIRPFTLSIRLAANMMAGHLIIGLLASISLLNYFSFSISIFLQSLLMILEFGVAIIQGFVFSILLLLYSMEYY